MYIYIYLKIPENNILYDCTNIQYPDLKVSLHFDLIYTYKFVHRKSLKILDAITILLHFLIRISVYNDTIINRV